MHRETNNSIFSDIQFGADAEQFRKYAEIDKQNELVFTKENRRESSKDNLRNNYVKYKRNDMMMARLESSHRQVQIISGKETNEISSDKKDVSLNSSNSITKSSNRRRKNNILVDQNIVYNQIYYSAPGTNNLSDDSSTAGKRVAMLATRKTSKRVKDHISYLNKRNNDIFSNGRFETYTSKFEQLKRNGVVSEMKNDIYNEIYSNDIYSIGLSNDVVNSSKKSLIGVERITDKSMNKMQLIFRKHLRNNQIKQMRNSVKTHRFIQNDSERLGLTILKRPMIEALKIGKGPMVVLASTIAIIAFVVISFLGIMLIGLMTTTYSQFGEIQEIVKEEILVLDNKEIENFYSLGIETEKEIIYEIKYYPDTDYELLSYYLLLGEEYKFETNSQLKQIINTIHDNLYWIEIEENEVSITYVLNGTSIEEYFGIADE